MARQRVCQNGHAGFFTSPRAGLFAAQSRQQFVSCPPMFFFKLTRESQNRISWLCRPLPEFRQGTRCTHHPTGAPVPDLGGGGRVLGIQCTAGAGRPIVDRGNWQRGERCSGSQVLYQRKYSDGWEPDTNSTTGISTIIVGHYASSGSAKYMELSSVPWRHSQAQDLGDGTGPHGPATGSHRSQPAQNLGYQNRYDLNRTTASALIIVCAMEVLG